MTAQAALEAINAYYGQPEPNVDTPDESIFDIAGVTGVTQSNLIYIDYALSADAKSPWTVTEIQAIVNEVRAGLALTEISNYFWDPGYAPKPDATTFAVAGITGVTTNNLDQVLEAIGYAHDHRYEYNPPFSLTNSNQLQAVVNDLLE